MRTVYVAGSLNLDQRIQVQSLPRAGETVIGDSLVLAPGGKGGNQAVAAARSGAQVTFVGAVGDDEHGRLILQALAEAEIDCAAVLVDPGTPTGTAVIPVDEHGENAIIVCPGANQSLTAAHVEESLGAVRPGDVLVLQLEVPVATVRRAARTARAKGAFVILNAAPAPTSVERLFDDVDLLVVNEHELAVVGRLSGATAEELADRTLELAGATGTAVICTAGAGGAFAAAHGTVQHVPAPSVAAVDTTGAGDTFVGYLAAALLAAPSDLAGALAAATAAAARAVTRPGAMESIPFARDLNAPG